MSTTRSGNHTKGLPTVNLRFRTGAGRNSLGTMFKHKRESFFKKYYNEVKNYINQNSKLLHERMINKKYPPLIRVKVELE